MLLRFKFSNFRSFADEQELSMIAARGGKNPDAVFHPAGVDEGVLGVCAIYGANASGKSNTLKALQFMGRAVRDSQRVWGPAEGAPLDPFVLKLLAPTRFEIDYIVNDVRYTYGFLLERERVLEEWLFAYPKGHKQVWFRRIHGQPISFGNRMHGANRAIERLMRANSLFLSAAAQNGHAALLPLYMWFQQSLVVVDERNSELAEQTIQRCDQGPSLFKHLVTTYLSLADIGIFDVAMFPIEGKQRPTAIHLIGDKVISFGLKDESTGTIALLVLLAPIIAAIETGGVVCVDEFDASLHPLLAMRLIQLFNSPQVNRLKAQLIFTTHDTTFLSSGHLRRDQIWFTDKNAQSESSLYPLSDFKPRLPENLEKGYLQGRYGGIPFLNADAFLAAFGDSNGK